MNELEDVPHVHGVSSIGMKKWGNTGRVMTIQFLPHPAVSGEESAVLTGLKIQAVISRSCEPQAAAQARATQTAGEAAQAGASGVLRVQAMISHEYLVAAQPGWAVLWQGLKPMLPAIDKLVGWTHRPELIVTNSTSSTLELVVAPERFGDLDGQVVRLAPGESRAWPRAGVCKLSLWAVVVAGPGRGQLELASAPHLHRSTAMDTLPHGLRSLSASNLPCPSEPPPAGGSVQPAHQLSLPAEWLHAALEGTGEGSDMGADLFAMTSQDIEEAEMIDLLMQPSTTQQEVHVEEWVCDAGPGHLCITSISAGYCGATFSPAALMSAAVGVTRLGALLTSEAQDKWAARSSVVVLNGTGVSISVRVLAQGALDCDQPLVVQAGGRGMWRRRNAVCAEVEAPNGLRFSAGVPAPVTAAQGADGAGCSRNIDTSTVESSPLGLWAQVNTFVVLIEQATGRLVMQPRHALAQATLLPVTV
eukprot:CAMPEP_0202864602 /NCGR_PEP_ID=MMETSP1391-20130828/4773_1 /ASSEMBLY_ACC=CAM_ASM_000867 /TAXON_ID=1034604 /ORGANISM="Chlamydomonas leiostraca, Strain SAG 11-49" /LENGTH=474 /DNA_ID=CAMNT_0049544359 /DNA_START=212 /DNA_END=1636 /DNA_ORIENTATION=+